MSPDLDMQEAARLIDRACDLLLLHRDHSPGLTYYLRQLPRDANGLRSMARHERANLRSETQRLFA